VAGRIEAQGVQCATRVLVGQAAATIVDYAKSEPASMVALASHGRSGVGRAVLGSVADRLVRSSGKSVFVVRPAPEQA
jgi:nucleotide-binding universal stress UspA family protein